MAVKKKKRFQFSSIATRSSCYIIVAILLLAVIGGGWAFSDFSQSIRGELLKSEYDQRMVQGAQIVQEVNKVYISMLECNYRETFQNYFSTVKDSANCSSSVYYQKAIAMLNSMKKNYQGDMVIAWAGDFIHENMFTNQGFSGTMTNWNPKEQSWYEELMYQQKLFVTEPYYDENLKKTVISILDPIKNTLRNTISGVVAVEFSVDSVEAVIGNVLFYENPSNAYCLVSENGRILYHTDMQWRGKERSDYVEFKVSERLNTMENAEIYRTDCQGEEVYLFVTPVGENGWEMYSVIPTRQLWISQAAIMLVPAIIFLLGVLIVLIIVLVINRSLMKPIRSLIEVIKMFSYGKNVKFEKNRRDEVGELSFVVEEMILALSETVGDIREIIDKMLLKSNRALENSLELREVFMEEMTLEDDVTKECRRFERSVKLNLENTESTGRKVEQVSEKIAGCGRELKEVEQAVDGIRQLSARMKNLVNDIDSLSFRTNMLSINSNVEFSKNKVTENGLQILNDEIKEISSQCIKAANEGDDCIADLQEAVEMSMERISRVLSSIESLMEESKMIMYSMKGIEKVANRETGMVVNISKNVSRTMKIVNDNGFFVERGIKLNKQIAEHTIAMNKIVSKSRYLLKKR